MALIIPSVPLLLCTDFLSPILPSIFDFTSPIFCPPSDWCPVLISLLKFLIHPCFDFTSPVLCAPAFSGLPHLVPREEALCFVFDTNGALPHQARTPVPKVAMIYKLANSRPARAVDTSDNSRRVNGDGGGAAGTSLAGVGAVSAIGNQSCEIPFQVQSTGAVLEPIVSHRSRSSRTSRALCVRAARSPGLARSLGNVSLPPGGVAARRTVDPPSPLDHSDPVNPLHPLTPYSEAARRVAEFFSSPDRSAPLYPNLPLTLNDAPSVPLKKRCFRI